MVDAVAIPHPGWMARRLSVPGVSLPGLRGGMERGTMAESNACCALPCFAVLCCAAPCFAVLCRAAQELDIEHDGMPEICGAFRCLESVAQLSSYHTSNPNAHARPNRFALRGLGKGRLASDFARAVGMV